MKNPNTLCCNMLQMCCGSEAGGCHSILRSPELHSDIQGSCLSQSTVHVEYLHLERRSIQIAMFEMYGSERGIHECKMHGSILLHAYCQNKAPLTFAIKCQGSAGSADSALADGLHMSLMA